MVLLGLYGYFLQIVAHIGFLSNFCTVAPNRNYQTGDVNHVNGELINRIYYASTANILLVITYFVVCKTVEIRVTCLSTHIAYEHYSILEMVSTFLVDIFRGIIRSPAMFRYRDMLWPKNPIWPPSAILDRGIRQFLFQILKLGDLIYPHAKKKKMAIEINNL